MHISLVAGRKTRGYARYSPAFISFTILPDRPLQSTLESRSRISPVSSTTLFSPLTRSSLAVPRQEASPFRSCCVCASLLKAPLYSCVCTQILLLPLTLCFRAVVFEPSWPLACIKQLVLFYLYSCVVISHSESLISIVYLACMITVHGLILGASHLIRYAWY